MKFEPAGTNSFRMTGTAYSTTMNIFTSLIGTHRFVEIDTEGRFDVV